MTKRSENQNHIHVSRHRSQRLNQLIDLYLATRMYYLLLWIVFAKHKNKKKYIEKKQNNNSGVWRTKWSVTLHVNHVFLPMARIFCFSFLVIIHTQHENRMERNENHFFFSCALSNQCEWQTKCPIVRRWRWTRNAYVRLQLSHSPWKGMHSATVQC